MATIVFVATTGLAGLAAAGSSKESYGSRRRLVMLGISVVFPSALLACLLLAS